MSDIYGEQYFSKFDSGLGYTDCPTWEDNAYLIRQIFGFSLETGDIPLRAMDVGCAFGFLSRHLRRRGVEAFGIDISAYAISNAPEDIRPHLMCYDISMGDVTQHTRFISDLVTCLETLEHINEGDPLDTVIQNIDRLIKPGGHAFLSICVEENPEHDDDDTHVTIRPRQWWKDKIETMTGMVEVPEKEKAFTDSLYYARHNGIFVFKKEVNNG